MKFGKSMGGGSSGMGSAFSMLKQFDKDGDGNITENGLFFK